MFYKCIVICYINNHLELFFIIYSCTCKHLAKLCLLNTHVDIINEDVIVRLYYICMNLPLHFYVNHYVLNLLIYLTFIGYIIIIKINPKTNNCLH